METVCKELYTALSSAQGDIEGARKRNINPHFKSRYADLASVWDACRDELTKNGLCVLQFPYDAGEGRVGLITTLAHKSGQSISERFSMPCARPTDPQAVGSIITYLRRYGLMAVVGIAPEDDDANSASPTSARASQAVPTKATTDWAPIVADALDQLSKCKNDVDRRALYATVRASSIDEPHKTKLLFDMASIIKGDKK